MIAYLSRVALHKVIDAYRAKSDPADALRSGSRSTRDRSAMPQKSLVILQAALSLVLLSIAGLVTLSLRNMLNQQFGFEREARLLVHFDTQPAGYTPERLPELYRKMEDRLSHMPGVLSEGIALYGPQDGNNWGESVFVEGQKPLEHNGSSWTRMSVHYLDTIGARILKGRSFGDQDTATSQKVAVVNEQFVNRFFPKEEPIGKHFGKDEQNHAGDDNHARGGVLIRFPAPPWEEFVSATRGGSSTPQPSL